VPIDQNLGLHSENESTNYLGHDMKSTPAAAAVGHKAFKAFPIFMFVGLSNFS